MSVCAMQELMAPSELIEGQLGDVTEYMLDADESLTVCSFYSIFRVLGLQII